MKLSTRLLLPLTASVALVMLLYGTWALRQREATLVEDAARETQAYATALALAIERALESPGFADVQEVMDRLGREPTIYGILLYDASRSPRLSTEAVQGVPPVPDSLLDRVFGAGERVAFERRVGEDAVYSVVRPLRDARGGVIGALEVAQPLGFLQADMARVRQRYLLNTLTLVLAVAGVLFLLVRRFVSRPLETFSDAVRALGKGDLSHRLDVGAAGGELAGVAAELNRMAAHLELARVDLVREAEERVALERRLRQSERLAAMGELAAGVAHEIAAPLHVIRGRADLLLGKRAGDAPGSRNLEIIVQQIDRITLIVRNLLSFAQRRELRTGRADLVETLAAVLEFVEAETERAGIECVLEAPAAVAVVGDADLLHQVFLNLILNAVHAIESAPGGVRRIDVRVVRSDAVGGSPTLQVEVEDSGPGIPAAVRTRIFDPFFTTKEGAQGTGLGLSVARAIVEDHGGTIEVREGASGGAVFVVSLAAAPAAVPAHTAEEAIPLV